MPASHIAQGKHLLLDLYGADHLSDIEFIDTQLCEAARICGATILGSHFHSFDGGNGVTGVAILAESHISIHTWPEVQYAAVDIFMCGDCDPEKAVEPLQNAFKAKEIRCSLQIRGHHSDARPFKAKAMA